MLDKTMVLTIPTYGFYIGTLTNPVHVFAVTSKMFPDCLKSFFFKIYSLNIYQCPETSAYFSNLKYQTLFKLNKPKYFSTLTSLNIFPIIIIEPNFISSSISLSKCYQKAQSVV